MRALRERPAAVFRYSSSVTDRSNFAEGSYVGIEAANADRTSTDERSGSAPAPTAIALRKSRRSRAWAVMGTSCEALSPVDRGQVAVSIRAVYQIRQFSLSMRQRAARGLHAT